MSTFSAFPWTQIWKVTQTGFYGIFDKIKIQERFCSVEGIRGQKKMFSFLIHPLTPKKEKDILNYAHRKKRKHLFPSLEKTRKSAASSWDLRARPTRIRLSCPWRKSCTRMLPTVLLDGIWLIKMTNTTICTYTKSLRRQNPNKYSDVDSLCWWYVTFLTLRLAHR